MCGIAGIVELDGERPIDAERLRAMNRTMRHRGPDDEGILTEGPVGLAMRRLSIIDVGGGHQPIHNEDGRISVVLNGEIYNYRELRATLVSRGHTLATRSDTEVLVHLYEDDGVDFVRSLRGMFAFALWDREKRQVLLARDRVGIKPLYYALDRNRLLFGSELKALLADPDLPRPMDPRALDAYLRFGYVPDPLTIFEGIRKLPPGNTLLAGPAGVEVRSYWEPFDGSVDDVRGDDPVGATDALEDSLRESIRAHLVSDVPVGALLSGGIDSSTVVALMASQLDRPIQTFSIGFREPAFDESPFARRVARHLRTDHHEMIVEPAHLDVIDRIVRSFDEPFGDPSALPTWFVSELASRSVKVVLSGDGGDELFGGYDRYRTHLDREFAERAPAGLRAALLRPIASFLPEGAPGKRLLRNLSLSGLHRYLDSVSYFPLRIRRELLAPGFLDGQERDCWDRLASEIEAAPAPLPTLSRLQRFDLETYLPGDILAKVDRMSMAHSLEARVPLLDHRVVEHALSLPDGLKIRNGTTKFLLKEVARRLLPADVVDRPKQGFAVPLEHWFRGALRNFLRDVLEDPRTLQREYFDGAGLRRFLRRQTDGRCSHELWILANLELWRRSVVGG